jgi:glutamate 5-kinase
MNYLETRKELLSKARRVVIKLGSSVVTTDLGLDHHIIKGLADEVSSFKSRGKEFIIVSSGAVAAGTRRMSLKEGARTIPQKQAAASVGQSRLMAAYEAAFGTHGIRVGQLLLTKDDFSHRERYINARNTLMTLLSWGAVPIINENDTVIVDEITLGDNDNLSALVANLADADLLLILTDMEGLMDCDPRINPNACLISYVEDITGDIKGLAGDTSSKAGRGGMASKLDAAAKVREAGIATIITRGKAEKVVTKCLNAETCGTLILPAKEKISARKHWLKYSLQPEGKLIIDDGAARAVSAMGRSLLPIGVVSVSGFFEHGAAVTVTDAYGRDLAMGLINYSSEEMEKIKGRQTVEIDWILGYRRNDEAIHADNLVLLEP